MSRDLNMVQMIGRCGQDPEIRELPNGNSVAKVSIAVGDDYTNKDGQKVEQTEWVNIEAFGKLADIFGQYVTKGKQIYIQGKFKTDKYPDKDTGKDKYSTKVVVSQMQLLGGRDDGQRATSQPAPQQSQQGAPPASADFSDDIPFFPHIKGQVI